MIEQIVSGGQTGVDRAALDVAMEDSIPCGGWCPHDRRAEDGRIDDRYPLWETPSDDYSQRTRWNVRDSDGTLIVTRGPLIGGTALTKSLADQQGKPCRVVDVGRETDAAAVGDWLREHEIKVLNVAGPRASAQPQIYEKAVSFLREVFRANERT